MLGSDEQTRSTAQYGLRGVPVVLIHSLRSVAGSVEPSSRPYDRSPALGRRENKRCRRAALIVERVDKRFQVPDGLRDHTQDVIVLASHPMILEDVRVGDSLGCDPIRLQLARTGNVNESLNRISSCNGVDTGTVASYHPVPLQTSHSASDRRGGQPYVPRELSISEACVFLQQPQQFPVNIIESHHASNSIQTAFQMDTFWPENFTTRLPPTLAFSIDWVPCWNNLSRQSGRCSVKASAWGLFALVSLLWGVPYLFIEIALRDIGPLWIAAGRVAIAALVMAPFLLHRQRWRALTKRWRALLVLAVVEVVVPLSLITLGQLSVPSGTTGVIIATEPIFIAVLAPLLLRKPWLSPSGWVGLVLGLIGVTTLLGLDAAGPGALLIVGAALTYGLGVILIDHWFSDHDALTVATAMILTAAPMLIATAAAVEPFRAPSDTTVLSLLMLGVACTAGGFTAFFALIKRAGPTTAALTTYTAPIIAVVAGVLVLHENLTLWQVLSCSLILVGAAFIVRPKRRHGRRPSKMNPAEQSSIKH